MHLESLVRLIESADFMTFRAIALRYLARKGYQDPVLTDGWRDGGSDVSVSQLPPNTTKLAIQITVERNWEPKIKKDAVKARDKLGLNVMLFICSRRVPEADFVPVTESLFSSHGVSIVKHDSQAIASLFFREGQTTEILRLMGIDVTVNPAVPQPADFRTATACSFFFFGKETQRFKESVIESAILAVLTQSRCALERKQLEEKVREVLGTSGVPVRQIAGAIDRMNQGGQVHLHDSSVEIDPAAADAVVAAQILYEQEWKNLRVEITEVVKAQCRKRPEADDIGEILCDLGALLMAAATDMIRSLARKGKKATILGTVESKLNHLNATLDSLGATEGNREGLLTELAGVVSRSPAGRQMLVGELYLQVVGLKKHHLIRALGGNAEVRVMLDASVAIPMLCSVLFEPVSQRFSIAASQLYNQMLLHGIPVELPEDYLEEVSTHLIDAAAYADIVDLDPDLALSENAFVAHYVSLRLKGKAGGFDSYLTSFGLNAGLRQADFYAKRDALRPRLQGLFANYQIRFRAIPEVSQASRKWAETEVMHAIVTEGLERPPILVRHDARVLGYLHQQVSDPDLVYVLCTWDRLHFAVRGADDLRWEALNPAVFSDLLSAVSSADDDYSLVSPLVLARTVTDRTTEDGARVWDAIVRIERNEIHDADLMREAHDFKRSYLQRRAVDLEFREIEKNWLNWKKQRR